MNKIKEALKEANRYDEVINILNEIISKNDHSSRAVKLFIDKEGKPSYHVDGKLVVQEAVDLLQLIDEETFTEDENLFNKFSNLWKYVNFQSDMLLHNYSVSISHRKKPETDMEIIRVWEILENLIICFNIDDKASWKIPEGWRKVL